MPAGAFRLPQVLSPCRAPSAPRSTGCPKTLPCFTQEPLGSGQHCQRTQNKDAAARTEPRVLRKPKFSHTFDFKMARKAGEQEVKLL